MARSSFGPSLAQAALARLAQDPEALASLAQSIKPSAEEQRRAFERKDRKTPHAQRNDLTAGTRPNRQRNEHVKAPRSGLEGLDDYYKTPLYTPKGARATAEQMQTLRALVTMAERQGVVKPAESGRWSWVFRQASGMSEEFCTNTINHFRSLLNNAPINNASTRNA